MKRICLMMFMLLLVGAAGSAFGTSIIPSPVQFPSQHPVIQQINQRILTQWTLIRSGYQSGKLTGPQAIALEANLKALRQRIITFLKQNQNHDLTAVQQTLLNTIMNNNSTTIGETPTSN